MKQFHVQIHYDSYHATFTVQAEDSVESIEKYILDKLGRNEIKFENNGFTSKKGKWITYEEIVYDTRPIQTEEVLGVKLGARV